MTPARRRLVLVVLTALTGVVVQWTGSSEHGKEALAVPTGAGSPAPATPGAAGEKGAETRAIIDLGRLKRPAFGAESSDLFGSRNWMPPPAPARAAAPMAPPLPFTYFGRMLEDGRTVVFLAQGERTFTVGAGDTIDHRYRVDQIGRESVILTYLPLQQKQTLPIGVIN
ncbi:MAG TPA: hypothetical protein VLN59_08915 [Burkholderiales bacterium]|nr:hypothetical protein [Burkholderiales bacterium]